MFDKLRKTLKGFTKTIVEKDLTESDVDDILDILELSLLQSDVAVEVIESINKSLKRRLVGTKVGKKEVERFVKGALRESISAQFEGDTIDVIERIKKKNAAGLPYLIVFLGINGTGKTTTLAKFAYLLKQNQITVAVAASDTFRAGAIEQIKEHTDNLQIKLIAQNYNSDPAAVARDAMLYAKSHKVNCVLVDTAGRIQTSSNLMQQIEKITNVTNPDLKIFVGDSLAGNDVVSQAREFYRYTKFDCSILTKSDADAKGGAALSIAKVTSRPILFLGVGQEYPDLQLFRKEDFLDTVLGSVGKVDSEMRMRIHDTVNVQDPVLEGVDENDHIKYCNLHNIPVTEALSVNLAEKIQVWVRQGRPDTESAVKKIKSETGTEDEAKVEPPRKVTEMERKVEVELESSLDPFEGISNDDIATYSDMYDVSPPDTDHEAAKMTIAIKRWIEQGRPSPETELAEPPRKVTEMERKVEVELESSLDPFEGISNDDIATYSDMYDVSPPDTDHEAAKMTIAIKRWIEQGRPSPETELAEPPRKVTEMERKVEVELESSLDPFEDISNDDIATYSDMYDVSPPDTDHEAAKMAIAIKRWIEQGRPSPETELAEPPRKVAEPEDEPEPEPKSKPKRKRKLFGLFRK